MALPQKIPYELMLTQWAQQLNPLIANALTQGVAVNSITLNANVEKAVPTTLNRQQLGWFLTDILSNSVVWRSQPFNSNGLLYLTASADTTISLWCF